MAETGEDTGVVPAVLGDLQDVDSGTPPVVGDTLVWNGTEWAAAGGSSPSQYGPALTYFEGTSGGSRADDDAINAAWQAMAVAQAVGYEAYPGVQPVLGEWAPVFSNLLGWRATEPGLYTAFISQSFQLTAAPGANSRITIGLPLPTIVSYSSGIERASAVLDPTNALYARRLDYLTLPISQGMIDAGWGGFDVKAPGYYPNAAERITNMRLWVIIERHSPGSTFDYYGNL